MRTVRSSATGKQRRSSTSSEQVEIRSKTWTQTMSSSTFPCAMRATVTSSSTSSVLWKRKARTQKCLSLYLHPNRRPETSLLGSHLSNFLLTPARRKNHPPKPQPACHRKPRPAHPHKYRHDCPRPCLNNRPKLRLGNLRDAPPRAVTLHQGLVRKEPIFWRLQSFCVVESLCRPL